MRHHVISVMLASVLLMYATSGFGADEPSITPTYRALLIACDEYVTYPDTTPTAHNNLLAMESLLERDERSFVIRRQDGITQSAEALRAAIQYAFKDAVEGDVSYLYISAHGDFNADYPNPQGELILSDGAEEARIGAQTLQSMLDPIPGVKLLIVDACNSGALIGKGVSLNDVPERVAGAFASPAYKALVSSGGSEPSWYWRSDADGPPLGSSYFTMALAEGAGYNGEYAADRNRDGSITLDELYQYLRVSYAAATAQVTPIEDDFVVFQYDIKAEEAPAAPLSGFVFDRTVLNAASPLIRFSFTVSKRTRVGYQLVFMRDGVWNWQEAAVWLDTDDNPDNKNGYVTPGRKTRSLSLSDVSQSDWGYAMLNVIRYEAGRPIVCASRVISVQPMIGDPGLAVKAIAPRSRSTGAYDPSRGSLTVWVGHTFPVSLTVNITRLDNDGGDVKTVRWLSVNQAARPQGLSPSGSLFYWDGRDQNGESVEPGAYRITASARVGQQSFSTAYIINVADPTRPDASFSDGGELR
ncbi:MAG: caspase family protein [Oscillospiraceae bacterium]|nr:caspase family protein [Oscillospiraceae bacterium]